MIKCDHVTCYACPNKEAEDLRAQLAAVTAERDMLLRDDREAKRLMTLTDGGRLTDRVAQLMDEWRNARAQLAAEKARADDSHVDAMEKNALAIAATRRADDLSRMVAACVEHIDNVERILGDEEEGAVFIPLFSRPDVAAERGRWKTVEEYEAAKTALAESEAEAAVWRARYDEMDEKDTAKTREMRALRHERDAAKSSTQKMRAERDEWKARAEKAEAWKETVDRAWAGARQATENHDKMQQQRDELGIQLAACQERLRLAMAAIKAKREGRNADYHNALAALDAVPGDALRQVGTIGGTPVYVDPRLPEHVPGVGITRHPLDRAHEASGVVTGAPFDEPSNGVKGVE